jgi:hypothetical protein
MKPPTIIRMNIFTQNCDEELIDLWGQYGRPSQASYYRQFPRRQLWQELTTRGLALPSSKNWHYLSSMCGTKSFGMPLKDLVRNNLANSMRARGLNDTTINQRLP